MGHVSRIIFRPEELFELTVALPSLAAINTKLLFLGMLGAACWGAAMGSHVGGVHIWLTTLKMPLFFLVTLALCFFLMHVVALLGGLRARPGQTLNVALAGLSITTICLGALSPVLALFAICAPVPSMASYLNLYIFCALCGLISGVFGSLQMARGLRALCRSNGLGTSFGPRPGRGVLAAWLIIYQFTGAQVAWTLRPWIGSSYGVEGYYSLSRGLSGNFYVGVTSVFARWLQEIGV